MKQDISKLSKEQIEAFIMGVQETTERGDTIDTRKELQWIVTEIPSGWSIKSQWIKAVTLAPNVSDPQLQRDNVYHYDDNFIIILNAESPRKLCSEICDAIDYINSNEFNED
jgi:hypothetical protein